jgi:phage tail protein X
MKLFGFHIVTDRDLTNMIRDGAASLAERKASAITRKYARNPNCIAAMFAARHGLKAEHAFLTEALIEGYSREVIAFADAMAKERGEQPIVAVRPAPAQHVWTDMGNETDWEFGRGTHPTEASP